MHYCSAKQMLVHSFFIDSLYFSFYFYPFFHTESHQQPTKNYAAGSIVQSQIDSWYCDSKRERNFIQSLLFHISWRCVEGSKELPNRGGEHREQWVHEHMKMATTATAKTKKWQQKRWDRTIKKAHSTIRRYTARKSYSKRTHKLCI